MKTPYHCMIVHSYYPLGETRVEREAQALIQRGYEVDVLCLRDDGEKPLDQIDGIQVYRLPVKRHRGSGRMVQMLEYLAFFLQVFFWLGKRNRWKKYQSVQVHNLPDFLVFSAIGPKLRGARVILDLHDLMPEFFASSSQKGMKSLPVRMLMLQEKLACRFADHVITVTDLWRQTLIQRGVAPEKVSVVMNVADSTVFQRAEIPVTGPNERQDGTFHLIYHGTLAHRYGIDLLVEAVAWVREQIPGIHLTVHGRGEYLDELRQLVLRLGVEEQVTFSTKYLPIGDIPSMLLKADLGVVPYRRDIFTDGILPTKLMEYVALGIPVLAAKTPIISHYFDETRVQYFQAGNVEDLTKKILLLYQHRDRLAQLAANADRFNQQYSWNRIAASYADTLDRLTGQTNQSNSIHNLVR